MASPKGKKEPEKHRKAVRKGEDLHFRITVGQKAAIDEGARRAGITMSSWIITTLLRVLREDGIEVREPARKKNDGEKK